MKLLELLVQEKVQWPEGALWAVQDGDKELKFADTDTLPKYPVYSGSGEVWFRNRSKMDARADCSQLADDWATKAVSKAEYDAAVAAEHRPAYTSVQDWYAELAPVITAAAEGKVVQYLSADGNWYGSSGVFAYPNMYRIKPEEPKTIKVNGFDVPEPMREAPAEGVRYYVASTQAREWCLSRIWVGLELDLRCLQRGLVYSTKEAAVAHAKAMLGINPYATEGADDEHA